MRIVNEIDDGRKPGKTGQIYKALPVVRVHADRCAVDEQVKMTGVCIRWEFFSTQTADFFCPAVDQYGTDGLRRGAGAQKKRAFAVDRIIQPVQRTGKTVVVGIVACAASVCMKHDGVHAADTAGFVCHLC